MAPRKRRGPRRLVRQWNALSPTYRARLERNGLTREAYLRGDALNTARGHKPIRTAKRGAANREQTERLTTGQATMADIEALEAWARSKNVPAWIPRDMSVDAKAALSQIDLDPKRWSKVHFDPRADGEPWEMTITPKGAPLYPVAERWPGHMSPYDRTYTIPGGGGRGEQGAREILDWFAYGDDFPLDPTDWDVGTSV